MLTLKNLTVKAGDKTILKNLNFHFEKGKVYVIMGPNGSGKSTLIRAIIGDRSLSIQGKILFASKNISHLPPEKVAALGIYASFQNPPAIDGVTIYQFFFSFFGAKYDILETKDKIDRIANALAIKQELLDRPMNVKFSGGEKKKLEVLQALLINPKLIIFDEIDSGVDAESLKLIFTNLKKFQTKDKTFIFITHYEKIFDYLQPDVILTIKNGVITR